MPAHWFLPLLGLLFLPPVVALAQTTAPRPPVAAQGELRGKAGHPFFGEGGIPVSVGQAQCPGHHKPKEGKGT